MSKYDIIIIGSGLGGLECGAILSKEGAITSVCWRKMNCLAAASKLTNAVGTGWIPAFTISVVWMKGKL